MKGCATCVAICLGAQHFQVARAQMLSENQECGTNLLQRMVDRIPVQLPTSPTAGDNAYKVISALGVESSVAEQKDESMRPSSSSNLVQNQNSTTEQKDRSIPVPQVKPAALSNKSKLITKSDETAQADNTDTNQRNVSAALPQHHTLVSLTSSGEFAKTMELKDSQADSAEKEMSADANQPASEELERVERTGDSISVAEAEEKADATPVMTTDKIVYPKVGGASGKLPLNESAPLLAHYVEKALDSSEIAPTTLDGGEATQHIASSESAPGPAPGRVTMNEDVYSPLACKPGMCDRGFKFFNSARPIEWWILVVCTVVLCFFDYFVMRQTPGTFRWHLIGIAMWICLACGYCFWVFAFRDGAAVWSWLTGYFLEWILSVDNLFVFTLIFTTYRTPEKQIHKAVFVGIIGAVLMRLVFFVGLSTLLNSFHWVRFIFGACLIYSGVEAVKEEDEDDESLGDTRLVWLMRCIFGSRLSEEYDTQDNVFKTDEHGRVCVTMLFVVIMAAEVTDIFFAVDSVSAKIAQIPDEYLAFSSSVMAMFGLRATFFVVHDLVQMFDMLKYGLCVILVFIGIELMIAQWVTLSPATYCSLILAVFVTSIFASYVKARMEAKASKDASEKILN